MTGVQTCALPILTDVSGTVQVAAHKNDVKIREAGTLRKTSAETNSSQSGIVHEGQQATREESAVCGAASPEGAGHALNTKWLEIGGGAGGGVLVLCLLLCKGKGPSNVSPSQP